MKVLMVFYQAVMHVLKKKSKKGKSGRSRWGNRVQNGPLTIDLQFGSSDFNDMKRVKSESGLVTCLPILAWICPSIRPELGLTWFQIMPFLRYLQFGSSDFDETFRKCS